VLDSRLDEDRSRWILAALSWFGVVAIATWLLLMLTFAADAAMDLLRLAWLN
jgi:hypothetical protein